MSRDPHQSQLQESRGPIAWMVHNRVTPNLMMLIFLIGGAILAFTIKKEVFPEFDLDIVTVRVPYPGSSPEAEHEPASASTVISAGAVIIGTSLSFTVTSKLH